MIRLVEGDLTRFAADAIVNAANSGLHGGGGVDGAIHRAGGPAIMADLERRYGPDRHCPTGQAVVSEAGLLPARVVIHAVGPVWRGGHTGEAALLGSAYATSLDLAAAAGARSVACPAISCGVFGYPPDAAAEVAVGAVLAWLDAHPDGPIGEVTWVLRSDDVRRAFQDALDRA